MNGLHSAHASEVRTERARQRTRLSRWLAAGTSVAFGACLFSSAPLLAQLPSARDTGTYTAASDAPGLAAPPDREAREAKKAERKAKKAERAAERAAAREAKKKERANRKADQDQLASAKSKARKGDTSLDTEGGDDPLEGL